MSATARSGADRRSALDFYSTPAWCTRAIVEELGCPRDVLDPCAGDGAILSALDAETHRRGFEIDDARARKARDGGHDVLSRDALDGAPWGDFGAVIMNPPFSHAEAFIERALAEAAGRSVVALLRLNWLGGMKRSAFHRKRPADVYVLPRRPSFNGGGTDATEYAWFAWGWGSPGGRWRILDLSTIGRAGT